MFPGQELACLQASFERVGMIYYVVALEDAPGAMTRDFHNHRLWNTGPAQVPNGSPAQVMKQKVRYAGPLASDIPTLAEIEDRFCSPGKKKFASPRLGQDKLRHIAVDGDGYGFRLSILAASLHPNCVGSEVNL